MIGAVMGLLSKAKPGSQGSAGLTPLDEPLLEPVDELVAVVPPEPFPAPDPAAPEDSMVPVPPSPAGGGLVDEHAVNPTKANPRGKQEQRMVARMGPMIAKTSTAPNKNANGPMPRLGHYATFPFRDGELLDETSVISKKSLTSQSLHEDTERDVPSRLSDFVAHVDPRWGVRVRDVGKHQAFIVVFVVCFIFDRRCFARGACAHCLWRSTRTIRRIAFAPRKRAISDRGRDSRGLLGQFLRTRFDARHVGCLDGARFGDMEH